MSAAPDAARTENRRRRRWPHWVGYAAGAWAAAYAVTALVWTVTGRGFPFGQGDPDGMGLLRNLPADVGAPVFAGVLAVTALLAWRMAADPRPDRTRARGLLLTTGYLVAGAFLLVVPDPYLLAFLGYAPMLLLGAPFGWPPDVNYAELFTWPLLNQVLILVGGFLLAATVVTWQRRTRGACESCGRGDPAASWTTPAAAARWGRWTVGVAVVVPLMYAVTRFAWLVGIPLTATDDLVADLHESGAVVAGTGLAVFAVVGAVLTLGLVQRWGERFPRWMPGLAGRRVPISLAVVPATVVGGLVFSTSLGLLTQRDFLRHLGADDWLALPMLFWPLWGVALVASALAYYLRRRGPCDDCGQG